MHSWFESKLREHAPDAELPMGPEFAAERLFHAWQGLGGGSGSVFGLADLSYFAGPDFDVVEIQDRIAQLLEVWLTRLDEEAAVTLARGCRVAGLDLKIPASVEEILQAPVFESQPVEPATATPDQIDAMVRRLVALPRSVSSERWHGFLTELRRLFDFIERTDGFRAGLPLTIAAPMSVQRLANVQANLDQPIPDVLLEIAAHHAGAVRVSWGVDRSLLRSAPDEVKHVLDGAGGDDGVVFDVGFLPELLGCRDWERDGEVTEWSTAIPVMGLESDYLAITSEQSVVYLSHEEGRWWPDLGEDFMEFLERWVAMKLVDLRSYCFSGVFESEGFHPTGNLAQALNAWYARQGFEGL